MKVQNFVLLLLRMNAMLLLSYAAVAPPCLAAAPPTAPVYRQFNFPRDQRTLITSDLCRCFSLDGRDFQALFYLAQSLRAPRNYRRHPELPLPRVHQFGFSFPSFLNPLCISIYSHRVFSVYLSSFPTRHEVSEDRNCLISAHHTQSLEQPVI